MIHRLLAGALALGTLFAAAPTLADDPNDPAMRSAAARARDRAIIRQLNRDQLAQVRARDARYADGWEAYRRQPERNAQYARERADFERRMAAWRRAVAACRSGRHEYCRR